MLSLAALLLELHSGETIESRMTTTRANFGSADEDLDKFFACKAWLAEEWDNIPPPWVRAINASLIRYFDQTADIGESGFCQLVHDEIVDPLNEEAKNFCTPNLWEVNTLLRDGFA